MIELIAIYLGIVAGLFGGIVGGVLRFEKKPQRVAAFLVPLTLCALLLHVPLGLYVVHRGFARVTPQKLQAWGTAQFLIMAVSSLLTGAGWGCACLVQTVFEDESR